MVRGDFPAQRDVFVDTLMQGYEKIHFLCTGCPIFD